MMVREKKPTILELKGSVPHKNDPIDFEAVRSETRKKLAKKIMEDSFGKKPKFPLIPRIDAASQILCAG